MTIRIDNADDGDLAAIRSLLDRLHLPASDLGAANQRFLAARAGGALVGCVALESYGDAVLLRSLAVEPRLQGGGIGTALCQEALAEARRRGARELWLLTTTAERYFARAGFARVDRSAAPPAMAASAEFRSLCPATAACMVLRLP